MLLNWLLQEQCHAPPVCVWSARGRTQKRSTAPQYKKWPSLELFRHHKNKQWETAAEIHWNFSGSYSFLRLANSFADMVAVWHANWVIPTSSVVCYLLLFLQSCVFPHPFSMLFVCKNTCYYYLMFLFNAFSYKRF